ncbi:serine-rich adhesin for platelets isoform X1 [Drosophila nasuta]|uniref:serine-rich adhesin for platelets isoform X1 n=1 Tax=Drosophila nasuta TaxID=42062 RepID=UPI00295E3265|nr:serine-rich adhesin for platelets isoform X1 [Drosophila nasuta]XP_060645479.1 serine-rich adhesin for platelets isoform X1 [Drosophila nasuta]XP_060645480.1 serine-rich adhesin for platelets isoform X1 [Drosophila nasuta]
MDKTICAIVEYEYAAKEPDELDLQKGAIIHRIKQMPGGWWQGTLKANGVTGMFPDNFVRVLEPSSNGNHSDDSAAVQLREKSATSNRRCKVIYSYTQVNDDELTLAVGDVIEFLGEVEEGWWRGRLRSKVGVFPSNFVQHIEPSPILASKRPPTIGATVTTSALTAKASNIATATTPAAAAAATTTTTAATAAPAAVAATTTKQQTKSRVTASTVDATTAAAAAAAAAAATAAVPTLPPKPQRDYCRVEFPYAPQNDDELELKVDDIISVISMELPDKGWWKGELRGKVGVFPDNFVKLLAPSDAPLPPPPRPRPRSRYGIGGPQRGGSFEFLGARMASFITTIFAPINEPAAVTTQQQSQRKISNTSHMTTTNANNSSSSSSTTTTVTQQQQQQQQQQSSASTTSKVYIKKTSNNSSSSSTSAGRKESFGSRDSLNDILSETGLPIGTVAAQRKSLENKNLDLSKLPGSKQSSNTTSTATTITTATSATTNNTSTYAELRKSLDNMDEKIKSPPPPVLGKKPSVPLKKTPTGNVTGHILSGGIKKKSGADSKLTSAMSHDVSDGLAGSKLIGGQLPDAGVAGNVVMRRAATIAVEDTDFDRVERGSILQDMRAGRVKAPKRRPPSAAINVLGESNNNSVYVNGSGMASSASELSEDGGQGKQATASSDDNSTGEEPQLVKPKPRDWEKQKAPWMEELKASQVGRKKTSPNVEPRGGAVSVAERTSKLFASEQVTATSSVLTTSATSSTTNNTTTSSSSSTSNATTATRVQSSAVTSSSIMQQSMIVESSSSSSSQRKESNSSSSSSQIISTSNSNHNDAIMSKSMSAAKLTNPTAAAAPTPASAAASSDEESRVVRPNSLSIRNRSVSPLVKTTNEKSNNLSAHDGSTQMQNNHHQAAAGAGAESTPRVQQLEGRVDKLEAMVLTQQRTIEELVRTLREETERVKVLRGELDKYAQCVTQV